MTRQTQHRNPDGVGKTSRGWMLLFVDGSGRMITLRWFKGMAVALVLLLAVLSAASAGLWYGYNRSIKAQQHLANALTVARHEAKTLRGEKETLVARLALAGANLETAGAAPGQTSRNPAPGLAEPAADARNVEVEAEAEPGPGDPEPSTAESAEPEPETEPEPAEDPDLEAPGENDGPLKVAVEGLKIARDAAGKRLEVRFTLKNTDAEASPVSGYSFVVLKERRDDPGRWHVFPNVDLVSGRPSQVKEGRYFQISRFKTIAFETEADIRPEAIDAATVMIYSRSGELILEKDFDLDEAS